MADAILVINAGSSSIKISAFRAGNGQAATEPADLDLVLKGLVEGIGTAPRFAAEDGAGVSIGLRAWDDPATRHGTIFRDLLPWLDDALGDDSLVAVGHRVVHGGPDHAAPVRLDAGVIEALRSFVPLAPLHQPHNLAPIQAIAEEHAALPQVACFDTAFHRGHADEIDRFALPRWLHDEGVRRYGFHGLSYAYIAQVLARRWPNLAGGRVVVAHLGNGASLCALDAGRSVDTTMGFTALDGLPMGTRCGAIDPGVLLYLMQEHGMDAAAIETLLYRESGLKGVSGISNDMRALLASDAPEAAQAVRLFVARIARHIAALASTLRGLDGIVFTGGIGEHAAPIRAAVCERLNWLGARVDAAANAAGGPEISAAGSPVTVLVVPTDEERMIAFDTLRLLGSPAG